MDSDDLPLNVSREILQESRIVRPSLSTFLYYIQNTKFHRCAHAVYDRTTSQFVRISQFARVYYVTIICLKIGLKIYYCMFLISIYLMFSGKNNEKETCQENV